MASVNVQIKLPILLKELHEVEWMSIGRHLGVPDHRIQTIQQQFFASSPQHQLFKVLEWWMDNTPENEVTWIRIAVALREIHYYEHSEVIVRRYCSGIELDETDELSSGDAEIVKGKFVYVNQEIVTSLLDLKFEYGKLTAKLEQLIRSHLNRNPFSRNRKLSKFIRILSTVLEKNILEYSFRQAFNELADQNDMFELAAFRNFVLFYFKKHPAQSRTGMNLITVYEQAKKQFMQSVSLEQFRVAVDNALPTAPAGYDHLTLILNEDDWSPLTLLALKKLLYKVFGVNQKLFLDFIARKGSIIVQYRFREDLREEIINLATENQEILKQYNVIKIMIGPSIVYQCKPLSALKVQDSRCLHPVQLPDSIDKKYLALSEEKYRKKVPIGAVDIGTASSRSFGYGPMRVHAQMKTKNDPQAIDIDTHVDEMKEETKRKNIMFGGAMGVGGGGLMGGGIGGGIGAVVGGIVGSVVPGPGTAVGIGVGAAIGAGIGVGTVGGLGGTIGTIGASIKERKKEKRLLKSTHNVNDY